jgi:DNA-binding NarL/FixJ family response regulator
MFGMTRVLIVNEVPLMCDVVRTVLQDQQDIEISGTVSGPEDAYEQAEECDVVLISSRLPNNGGLRLTQVIKRESPTTKVLILGLADQTWEIMPFIEAGASGYVLKDGSIEDLVRAIRAAKNGRAYVSAHIAGALVARLTGLSNRLTATNGRHGLDELTPREGQVFVLMAHGCTNQQIADRLSVTVGTVKNHVHRILRKLGLRSRKQAIFGLRSDETTQHLTDDS